MRSGAIVIHCFEFSRMVDFWSHVLNYVPREPAAGGGVVLTDPKRRGPNLCSSSATIQKPGEAGCIWDLYTLDAAREVDRLISLGAKRYAW